MLLSMESTTMDLEKDSRNGESISQYAIESLELNGEALVLNKCRRKLKPRKALILDVHRLRASASSNEFFLHHIHGLHNSIPKHIATFDEKYILRCHESIRNCALRAATWNFTSRVENHELVKLGNEYPLVGKTEVSMNFSGDWIVGTLSGSQTIINILKSPLLKQLGSLVCHVNVRKMGLLDVNQPFDSDCTDSVYESTSISSLRKESKVFDHIYLSEPMHKRDASISSTDSSSSDQSSYSLNGVFFQGFLESTWENGLPNHVFTLDDKKEVYMAKLSKVESLDGKNGWDCVYTFYSGSNRKKECVMHELELEHTAKMFVSTSINFSSDNSEIRETRFILSVSNDNQLEATNQGVRKNKRLKRKVVDIFKSTHSHKPRSISELGKSSAVLEDTSLDPYEDVHNNFLDLAPNLELAAIVVKDVCNKRKEAELGGWGLKFLRTPSLETSISSKWSRDNGECSTSMDIIIPAGFHGGPRTRVGGPSGLTERWVSGGVCDCGGWDMGCPVTILKTRTQSTDDYSSRPHNSGKCKSVDLFMQGSKQNTPVMKLVNCHEDLYYIHFQSTLSSLQSFAIAAAIIHSRSPLLPSKVYSS